MGGFGKRLGAMVGCGILGSTTLVPGSPAQSDETIALDVITVTTTRTEDSVIETLAGASVVPRETIDRFQPNDIGDVLIGIPGVATQEDGNDPGSSINIRGLQDFGRVNVMIEGARQNFQRSGHGANGIFYLEPELIKQVDIVRGPVSTIYGSGAIGGVVNFSLIDGADFLAPDQNVAASQKVRFDTNGSGTLTSTTAAARVGQGFDALANVVWRRDDSYDDGSGNVVPNTGEQVVTGLLKANYRPAEGHHVSGLFLRQENDYDTGIGTTLRETDTNDTTASATWTYDSPDNPLIDLSASGYFTSTTTDQTRLTGATAGAQRDFEIRTFGTDIYNTSRFSTGPVDHVVTVGFDAFDDTVETNDPLGTGDEFTPSGDRRVIGGFIQNQIALTPWLDVIGALRFDHYELKGGGADSDGSRVSPKITVGITPLNGLQFYGTYAEGYRAPAITEVFNSGTHDPSFPFVFLPNPDLRPETARNIEFGANISADGLAHDTDSARLKVTYFHNRLTDFIEGNITGFNPRTCFRFGTGCGVFQYRNVASARIEGVEIEGSYAIGPFFTTVAYSHIRGDNRNTNEPLQSIRPDAFSTTLGVNLLEDKLTLGGRVTLVDAQDRVPTGSENLISRHYELVDLFASYKHNEAVSVGVTLNNILDQDYTKYRNVNPSEGFSASFSATVKFGV
ncbi:MAG: TonB-dependent hemoglobin/transferrin/lactoferrin family receptor [Pseudomonadota bacterium]